jgi:hypothetical protein
MSQRCAIEKCDRTSKGFCDCCTQHLCLEHLTEHNTLLISQLDPITDKINTLDDHLKTLNVLKLTGDCRRDLEQWRDDCHEKIDALFKQKSQELDQLVDEKITKGKERIDRIRLEALEVIKKKEATQQDIVSLMSTIRQLEKTIDNIEQTCFTLSIRPLVIDDTTVVLKKTSELDLSTLPVYKTISCSTKDSYVLASNDRFLLIHQEPSLCFVDRQMNIVKHAVWSRDLIYDICWSSTLDRFIVIGGRRIFLVNENSVACENAETIEKREWLSCTCSETSLFLSTNTYSSCIMEFRLSPSIELVKTWKSPQTCA